MWQNHTRADKVGKMKTLCYFCLLALSASAEIVRLPARMTHTTTTYSTLTGITIDEESKSRTSAVVVDVAKKTTNGFSNVIFSTRPSAQEDKTDVRCSGFPFTNKVDFVNALLAGKKEVMRIKAKKEELTTELFNVDGFRLTYFQGLKKSFVELDMSGESYFELEANHLQQLVDVLKRIK